MQSTIEIVRTRNGRFSFAVEFGEGGDWYVRDGLVSISACVKKASAALGPDFKFANIAYGVLPADDPKALGTPPRALLKAGGLATMRYWW